MTKPKSNALAKNDEPMPQMNLPFGVEITDTALIIPATLDDAQLMVLSRNLRRMQCASSWWIADLALFLKEMFDDKARPLRAAKLVYDKITGLWPQYERSTLKFYASVAKSVPPALRVSSLSFTHHQHVAALALETNGRELQSHYLKKAVELEMTAEDLRLMVADTKRGVQSDIVKRINAPAKKTAKKKGETIEITDPDAQLPIARPEIEPECLTGTHAQLAADIHRSIVRLREWYASEKKKSRGVNWTAERKRALIDDLNPVLDEMHKVAEIAEDLTKGNEYEQ